MINMIAAAIYVFVLLLVVAAFISARTYYKRTGLNLVLVFLCISVMGWIIVDIATLFIPDININLYIWNLGLLFIAFACLTIFVTIFQFFFPEHKFSKLTIILLLIIPSITSILSLTSPFHPFLRDVEFLTVWPRVVEYSLGVWAIVHAIFSAVLILSGIAIAIHGIIKKPDLDRVTATMLVFALVAVLTANILYMTTIISSNIDVTSIGAGLAVIIVHIALSDNKYDIRFRMFNTLKSRITFPILIVLLCMISAMVIYVARTTRLLSESFDRDRLTAASQAVQAYLRAKERQIHTSAIAISNSAELIRLINEGSTAGVFQYLVDAKALLNVHEVIIVGHDGSIIAHSNMREGYVSNIPLITMGLNDEILAFYTRTPTNDMIMTTFAPLNAGNGNVANVVVNLVIGTYAFVDDLKAIFNVDITIFAGNMSVATTLVHPETGYRTSGTPIRQDIGDRVLGQSTPYRLFLDVLGVLPYYAYYFPLFDADGITPSGMIFVGISRESILGIVTEQLRNVILISMLGIVIVSVSAFLLIHKSLKPLDKLAEDINNVSAGRININIDRSKITTDEIGVLTSDIVNLMDIVQSMLIDLEEFSHESSISGDIDYRIDTSKYHGSFREMIEGINNIVAQQADDIQKVSKTLTQMADGEHNIIVVDLPGKKNVLSQSMQYIYDVMESIHESVITLAKDASQGKLDTRQDASKFKGGWEEIILSLNNFADAVSQPIDEIRNVMSSVSHSQFNNRVNGDYAGDFLAIKNDVNGVVYGLRLYIQEIDACLNALASGDLTHQMSLKFEGEFSTIEHSIKNINQTLHKTMSEINAASNQVLSGAKQISASAMDLATGASVQANSVQELTASVTIISEQIKNDTAHAQEATAISGKSSGYAKKGNDNMEQMLHAMLNIKQSSSNISKIIKTIQDIAFQTNLLALNASVEAARAGEHGLGFSVVAEEVRNLAARSEAAASQTTEFIEESISRVDAGSNIAETTGKALTNIVASVNEVMQVINEIYASAKEQALAVGQIDNGLGQISAVVQNNSAVSEETAAAAEELNSQAELLRELVSYFKL